MKIPILMYHQIDPPPPKGTPLRGLCVAPASFSWQMWLLRKMGYRGLSMRDLEPYLSGTQTGKVVGITFDDGYKNNVVHALPVLVRNGFTATCYGVSGLVGATNVWDAGKVEEKPLMSVRDWRTWLSAGMDVGSHTESHADLSQLNANDAQNQIENSKLELEKLLDCEVRHFCYPYGKYLPNHCTMVRNAGYTTATTTQRGRVGRGDDPMALRRIMVARATNPLQFYLKIATSYEDKRG